MTEIRQAICPVCGTSHGRVVTERVEGKPYIKLATGNYWEKTAKFDPDKPFGVIQETKGRGTFKMVGYFSPEEDKDGYFPLVKRALLSAVESWIAKGWLTRKEVRDIIED